MSTQAFKPDVAVYIQRLKSFLHVKTDEQLAAKLGRSKQSIANWRRRGDVPTKVRDRISNEFGVIYPHTEDVTSLQFGTQAELTIAHASALYCVHRYINKLGRPVTLEEWMRLGHSHPYLVQAYAGYVGDLAQPIESPEKATSWFFSEIDKGRSYYPFLEYMMNNPVALPQELPQTDDGSDGTADEVPQ